MEKPVELMPDGVIMPEAAIYREQSACFTNGWPREKDDARPDSGIATSVALSIRFFPQWYKEINEKAGTFHTRVIAGSHGSAILLLANNEADLLLAYSGYHETARQSEEVQLIDNCT
ncbi:hypothetical protein [Bartonella choladocola]|uniref:Uncharacterized protein n=1 Tax=Bartonella choladocola TaxID=2750995 RepID=A0A1U9MEZ7_9HYPH|nr:hypothetical protein [Bartonella choladocola]AQT46231.1 hypothetical protein BBC0122_000910 [Bartonella choladocola]